MVDQGFRCGNKNPQYMYMAPFYGQAKRIAWDYLKEYTSAFPGRHVHEGELRIDIPRMLPDGTRDRVRFMLMGADNPAALPGLYLDGVILDEFGVMMPSVWSKIIRPMLSDREGWAIFIGTLEGKNHFWDLYSEAGTKPGWYVSPQWMGDAYETNIIPIEELESARREMPPDEFDEQYRSIPSGTKGAYYSDLMIQAEEAEPSRITRVPYDPALKVEVFFDLGVADAMAVWVIQCLGDKEIRAIDYHEAEGEGLNYFSAYLQQRPYGKGIHRVVFPHDGRARSLGAEARTRQEIMEDLMGMHVECLDNMPIKDGIHAVRMLLPKMWFDRENCNEGILALKNYTKIWDDRRQVFLPKPRHDRWSHGADAFRYVAMGLNNAPTRETLKTMKDLVDFKYDPFSLY